MLKDLADALQERSREHVGLVRQIGQRLAMNIRYYADDPRESLRKILETQLAELERALKRQ